jgi:hypothetical protein
VNDELEKMWKEVVVTYTVLFRNLPGGTGENYERPQSGIPGIRAVGPPEYEASVLTTRPRSSMQFWQGNHFLYSS